MTYLKKLDENWVKRYFNQFFMGIFLMYDELDNTSGYNNIFFIF